MAWAASTQRRDRQRDSSQRAATHWAMSLAPSSRHTRRRCSSAMLSSFWRLIEPSICFSTSRSVVSWAVLLWL
jgi:hypothetical protein